MNFEMEQEKKIDKKVEYDPTRAYDDKWLRVYHDEENDRYYIDVFAASSLYLTTYDQAGKWFDRGDVLFLITMPQLERLKQIFKDRITYIPLNNKSKDFKQDFIDLSKNTNDLGKVFLGNEIFTYFDNFKNENGYDNLDDMLNQSGDFDSDSNMKL